MALGTMEVDLSNLLDTKGSGLARRAEDYLSNGNDRRAASQLFRVFIIPAPASNPNGFSSRATYLDTILVIMLPHDGRSWASFLHPTTSFSTKLATEWDRPPSEAEGESPTLRTGSSR